MKYWIFVSLGLALILVLGYYLVMTIKGPNPQSSNQKLWETKVDEQEPISIKVIPLQLGAGQNPWKFEVIFTTHSGDLDVDASKAAVLVDDKGNVFQPTSWEGPGPGGHHISGNLLFDPITPLPNFVELKIKNVGGIPERAFRWSLE